MILRILAALWLLVATALQAQPQPSPAPNPTQRPKLVVGIVVDQMRWDFLYRYWSAYGTGGFKRLLGEGYAYHQMHYDYVPTYTGPGHASIYTGCPPSVHGIIGNYWFDVNTRARLYCASATHDSIQALGGAANEGRVSPQLMLSTTWPDQLREATMGASRVIGIAIKNRGAILTTGHSADGAYWVDKATGAWMTSTYYRRSLPDWVERFNRRGLKDSLAALGWTQGRPATNSSADAKAYEAPIGGRTSLPYDLRTPGDWDPVLTSPHGNTLSFEFAKAALAGEGLGRRTATDVLALSLSTPDYAGHSFGPHSPELEDLYVKLDAELAAFIGHLDRAYGRANYLLFLTADHGVKPIAEFWHELKLPSGRFGARAMLEGLERQLDDSLGAADWLMTRTSGSRTFAVYENQQVYLNAATLAAKGVSAARAQAIAKAFCLAQPHVARVYTRAELDAQQAPSRELSGYYPRRSGDLLIIYEPGWDDSINPDRSTGTTHGSGYSYDTHVPMLFFGWRVRPGESYRTVGITDIAPSICAALQIENPSGSTGHVLTELLEGIRRR